MVELEFNTEYFDNALIEELLPLARDWWEEQTIVNFEPELYKYMAMFKSGVLRVFTARLNNELVGYAIFGLSTSAFSGLTQAVADQVVFVKKARKGLAGYNFVKFCVDELMEDGFVEIVMNVPEQRNFSVLLKRLGFNKNATTYMKEA